MLSHFKIFFFASSVAVFFCMVVHAAPQKGQKDPDDLFAKIPDAEVASDRTPAEDAEKDLQDDLDGKNQPKALGSSNENKSTRITNSKDLVTDRIKAVPRKHTLKRRRLELSPAASISLNDAFYQHYAVNGALIFYPHDAFGFGLGVDWFYGHDSTKELEVVRKSRISVPAEYLHARTFAHFDFYWTPIYGKFSLFDSGITYFEIYGTAGLGLVKTPATEIPWAANVGLGQRFLLSDWLALRFEVRDHLYIDKQIVNDQARSDIQSYVMFMAGISIFIPPSFDYSGP